jgi:aromatic-L-amino-acid decarboxylase
MLVSYNKLSIDLLSDVYLKGTVLDYRNMQLALGRRFRSLKIFFVLRSYGAQGFQAHQRRLIELAKAFESLVAAEPDWELVVPRRWSLVAFRKRPADMPKANVEKLNRKIWDSLSKRRDIFLTQTVLGSDFCFRFAVGSPLTREEDITKSWDIILEVAASVTAV